MAKPSNADIEAVYKLGESAGMTRDQVDIIAVPHISILGRAFSLTQVRSHGELRTIHNIISAAAQQANRNIERAINGQPPTSAPRATPRQVDYIFNLLAQRAASGVAGGFMTGPTDRAGIEAMTKSEASIYITSLTEDY
jgi:hypothetical protein